MTTCCLCKRVRDDDGREPQTGEWVAVEEYLHVRAGISTSHSYCPECYEKIEKELCP